MLKIVTPFVWADMNIRRKFNLLNYSRDLLLLVFWILC